MLENGFFYPFFKNDINCNNYSENLIIFGDKDNYRQTYNDLDYFRNEILKQNENNDNSTLNESYLPKFNEYNNNLIKFDETIPLPDNIPEQEKTLYFGLKKRERPGKKKNQYLNQKKQYIHTKNKFDNILTKIQVSYVNFLVSLTNSVLEAYGKKELKFKFLDSKIKKNIKSENREKIKTETIGDILRNKISGKFSTLDKGHNFKIYEKIEKNGYDEILKFLNQKFLFFFESIYYKNLRKFNLKDFGLMDLEIELPKIIGMYENLLMKNQGDKTFEEYKIKMEKCIKKHFLNEMEEKD